MAKSASILERLPLDTDILLSAFQLTKLTGNALLNHWLSCTGELNNLQKELLEVVFQKSINRMGGWNEEELKMKLISFIFLIADFEEDGKIATFYERSMSAIIDNQRLSVKCDCLIARPLGFNTPKTPYFFLQEFKRGKGDSYDPEGQMLAAMLIAQYKNADNKPIYGAWLTGGIWFFTILDGKNYYMSNAHDATQKAELLQIIFILRKLKELILNR
jgi:hypothetical protein